MAKLTETEIRSLLDSEIRGSVGYTSGELSSQRQKALEYYYGEPFGNEMEGRSSYVSRDVADTVEWIMPSIMRIFTGGDEVVRFEPQGPEDDKKAKQATDYINYVFQRQNDGFLTLYTWFKDALISKNGFVKVYWEKYDESKTENYEGLTDDEFVQIASDPDVEILEHTAEAGPMPLPAAPPPPPMPMPPGGMPPGMPPVPGQTPLQMGMMPPSSGVIHSIKLRRTKKYGKCCVVPVPPEEILVNSYPTYPLKKNRFVCHRRKVTISELKEMGYEDVDDLPSYERDDYNSEKTARYSFDGTDQLRENETGVNRYVWLAECYVKLDVDGDGIAEYRKITMAGDRILDNEEFDGCPFVTLTPIILPHKLYGMSVADLIMDIQLLKSTVFRQILDNMYLANNGRYMALDGMVNIDDLLTSRPGGIVRVKTFDAVKPMQPPLLGAPAFNLLEYIDQIKENRTGVTRYNQGIDADSLNKTATGINQIMSAAQQRTELIARVFAETGVKDLFYSILECVQKHQDKPAQIRLNNEWVTMDPREWSNKFDLTVSVGLGTGSKESVMQGLSQTIQLQMAALQGGLPIVTPVNIYNSALELLKAQSIKGGDMFFTHPDQIPPAPPQANPDVMKIEAKAEADKLKLQTNYELKSKQREIDTVLDVQKQKMEEGFRTREMLFEEKMRAKEVEIEARIKGMELMMQERQNAQDMAMQERHKAMDMVAQERDRAAQKEEKPKEEGSKQPQVIVVQDGKVKTGPTKKTFKAKKNPDGTFVGEMVEG